MNAKTEPGQIDSHVIDNFSLGLPTGVTKHTLVPERFIFIVRIVCTQLDSTGFAYPVLIGRGVMNPWICTEKVDFWISTMP